MADEEQPQPNRECKSLDDRAKLTEFERIRHLCAHVLERVFITHGTEKAWLAFGN
jgi:hypothetical protein